MPTTTLPTSRHFVTQLLTSLPSVPSLTEDAAAGSNPLSAASEEAKKRLLALQVLFPNEFVPALDLLDRHLVTRFRICDSQQQSAPIVEPPPEAVSNENLQTKDQEAAQTKDGESSGSDRDAVLAPTKTSGPKYIDSHGVEVSVESALDSRAEDQTMTDVSVQENNTPARSVLHAEQPAVYYVRSAQQRSSRFSTSYDTTTCYEVRLQAWNCSCPAFAFAAFPAMHPEPPVATHDPLVEEDVTTGQRADQALNSEWIFGGVSLGDGMPPVCKHLLACVLTEKCSGLFGGFVEERNVSVEEAAGWAAGWGD